MSMQNVEYQGYGIDLGDYKSNNPDFISIITALINSDETEDLIRDHYLGNVEIAHAFNSDQFECLIYIPAIIPVAVGHIKTYDESGAQELLTEAIEYAIRQEKLTDKYLNNDDQQINKFHQSIIDFVEKYADYSYEHDWSDLV